MLKWRGVGAFAPQHDLDPHRALTAHFDDAPRRFGENREITYQQIRPKLVEFAKSRLTSSNLFACVKHPGHFAALGRRVGGQFEHHRQRTLHVARANAVERVVYDVRQRRVARHRVEVAGNEHARRVTTHRPSDNVVPHLFDLEVGHVTKALCHQLRQGGFVARDRRHAHESERLIETIHVATP